MSVPEHTPVLVGVGQLEQRSRDLDRVKEPLELMLDAARLAAADTGAPRLLERASSVRVIRGVWPYADPAAALREELGCPGAESALTPIGGNMVQTVVNQTALDVQSGRHDVVVITAAEWGYSISRARKEGRRLPNREAPGTPDRVIGEEMSLYHEAEQAIGLLRPIQFYPLFENALRHARGESIAAHLERIGELWARFSRVAESNPHAWIRRAHSAEEIVTPSPANRPVSFPYPKLMNSNNAVDQAAALILCSAGTARRLGIPAERWIFPWAGSDAHDHPHVSNREHLHTSPAIRIAGTRCLELAGLTPESLDYVDLYSCFPSAVQIAARELGLDEARELTVTGGMTFAGGPLNSYVMHSIARMGELLRAAPEACGLVTANGGFLTKHAFGIYSATPPPAPFRHAEPQAEVDALPRREVAMDHQGPATIETYTVMYGAEGPESGYLACLLEDGRRAWAHTRDPALLEAMASGPAGSELCGRRLRLGPQGRIELL